jgi:hypothetical protein
LSFGIYQAGGPAPLIANQQAGFGQSTLLIKTIRADAPSKFRETNPILAQRLLNNCKLSISCRTLGFANLDQPINRDRPIMGQMHLILGDAPSRPVSHQCLLHVLKQTYIWGGTSIFKGKFSYIVVLAT